MKRNLPLTAAVLAALGLGIGALLGRLIKTPEEPSVALASQKGQGTVRSEVLLRKRLQAYLPDDPRHIVDLKYRGPIDTREGAEAVMRELLAMNPEEHEDLAYAFLLFFRKVRAEDFPHLSGLLPELGTRWYFEENSVEALAFDALEKAWAEKAPRKLLDYALAHYERGMLRGSIYEGLEAFGKRDPMGALAFASEHDLGELHFTPAHAILRGVEQMENVHEIAEVIRHLCLEGIEVNQGWPTRHIVSLILRDQELGMRLLDENLPGVDAKKIRFDLARDLIRTDPKKAMRLLADESFDVKEWVHKVDHWHMPFPPDYDLKVLESDLAKLPPEKAAEAREFFYKKLGREHPRQLLEFLDSSDEQIKNAAQTTLEENYRNLPWDDLEFAERLFSEHKERLMREDSRPRTLGSGNLEPAQYGKLFDLALRHDPKLAEGVWSGMQFHAKGAVKAERFRKLTEAFEGEDKERFLNNYFQLFADVHPSEAYSFIAQELEDYVPPRDLPANEDEIYNELQERMKTALNHLMEENPQEAWELASEQGLQDDPQILATYYTGQMKSLPSEEAFPQVLAIEDEKIRERIVSNLRNDEEFRNKVDPREWLDFLGQALEDPSDQRSNAFWAADELVREDERGVAELVNSLDPDADDGWRDFYLTRLKQHRMSLARRSGRAEDFEMAASYAAGMHDPQLSELAEVTDDWWAQDAEAARAWIEGQDYLTREEKAYLLDEPAK